MLLYFYFSLTVVFSSVSLPQGFLKAIVSPMYKSFSKVPGVSISHCLASLENNIKNWELLLASDESGERIRTAADVAVATASWTTQSFSASASASVSAASGGGGGSGGSSTRSDAGASASASSGAVKGPSKSVDFA